jgi:hypothetical protein
MDVEQLQREIYNQPKLESSTSPSYYDIEGCQPLQYVAYSDEKSLARRLLHRYADKLQEPHGAFLSVS